MNLKSDRTCRCNAFGMPHRPDQCQNNQGKRLVAAKVDLLRLAISMNARRLA